VTVLAAIAITFDGFDLQILGVAIPSMVREWHVARSQFGPALAMGLAGMAIGGPVAGYCGDRFGRRITITGCIALFGVTTIATAFVHGLFGLTVLRLFTGIGTGGALPNVSAYTAEFAPLRRRPLAVKLAIVCVPLGGMLCSAMAIWVLPTFGWRGLYAIGGVLPLALAIVFLTVLPESPRFLAHHPAQWPQLVHLLNRIGHSIPAGTAFENTAERGESTHASLRALFSGGLARETTGLWIAFFFCLGSIYLVFGWLPTMLTARGLTPATANTGMLVYNLGGVLGVLIWAMLVPLLGSRGPLLSGALAGAASALAFLIVPIQSHGGHWLLIVCLGINGLLANAVQTSMYALAAHVYPTSVRASGVAYSAAMGRMGGLLSSLFGSHIIQTGVGTFWQTLAVAMVLAAAGLAWVRSHYPAISKLDAASSAAADW
jgi:AAHS family 4-hydroxybenzoate transporter-like MFS transporter